MKDWNALVAASFLLLLGGAFVFCGATGFEGIGRNSDVPRGFLWAGIVILAFAAIFAIYAVGPNSKKG